MSLPFILWRSVRGWAQRRYALSVASIDQEGQRRRLPSGLELYELGQKLGYATEPDETLDTEGMRHYAKRVYGVNGIEEASAEDTGLNGH